MSLLVFFQELDIITNSRNNIKLAIHVKEVKYICFLFYIRRIQIIDMMQVIIQVVCQANSILYISKRSHYVYL